MDSWLPGLWLLPLPLEDLGGRKGAEKSQNPGRKSPWPRRRGLGRQGGAAPCVVTLCEYALGQVDSHWGFMRTAYGGLARPTVADIRVPQGRARREPPLHPRPAGEPVPRPPTRSLKSTTASDSGSCGTGSCIATSLFPQRNPSAADRELV